MSGFWPFRRKRDGAGYYVVSRFRLSDERNYRVMECRWYPWQWRANQAAWPRYFKARLSRDPELFGIILSSVIPASGMSAFGQDAEERLEAKPASPAPKGDAQQ